MLRQAQWVDVELVEEVGLLLVGLAVVGSIREAPPRPVSPGEPSLTGPPTLEAGAKPWYTVGSYL